MSPIKSRSEDKAAPEPSSPKKTASSLKTSGNKGTSSKKKSSDTPTQKQLDEALAFEKAVLEMASLENHEALHFIPSALLGTLDVVNDNPRYVTTTRWVDMEKLDPEVEKTLDDLIERFTRETTKWVNVLDRRELRSYCIGDRYREMRDALVAGTFGPLPGKYAPATGLQARMWKAALQVASSVQSNRWRKAQSEALSELRKRPVWSTLSDAERAYVRALLNELTDSFFYMMNTGNPEVVGSWVKVEEEKPQKQKPKAKTKRKSKTKTKTKTKVKVKEKKFEGTRFDLPDAAREDICGLIRHLVHEHLGRTPVMSSARTLWLDTGCVDVLEEILESVEKASASSKEEAAENTATAAESKAVDAVNAVKAKASGPRTQYLNIMTTRKGQRVRVPLKGFVPGSLFDGKPREDNTMKLEASTIRIIRTERGFKAVFQHDFKTLDPLPVPPPKTALFEAMNLPATMKLLRIVGLDLGVTEVFTDDDGNHWGGSEDYVVEPGRHRKGMMDARQDEAANGQIKTRTGYMPGLNALMRKFAQYRDEKLRRRNELRDQAKNTKDPVKRRNIEKNNLGSKAFDKKCAAYKAAITQIVNRAINRLFLKNPADVYVLECFGSSFDLSGFSKKTRRYLSSWVRGLIRERICFKCSRRGVKVVEVAAAYSSQVCPVCHAVDHRNRSGDHHGCDFCDHEGDADAVGAYAMLTRAANPKFRRFMTRESVLEVEYGLHLAYCAKNGLEPLPEFKPRVHKRSN